MQYILITYLFITIVLFSSPQTVLADGECCNCGGVSGCGISGSSCPNPAESCQVNTSSGCPTNQICTPGSPGTPTFRIPGYDRIGFPGFKYKGLGIGSAGIIVQDLLPYAYVFAGLLLFAYLLYGGFHLATSFGSPKAILEAWLIIFRAFIGFILVFASFWLVRIVEAVFGLKILGG
jgi:hypothetical protein